MNNIDEEIIIGINKPKTPKKNNKKKDNSPKKKKVAQKATYKKREKVDKSSKPTKSFIIILIIVLIVILIFLLMNLNICQIKNVELVDSERVTKEQILELANFEQYNNLFSINKLKIKEDIEKNAYIEDAKISRKFPNTIEIKIKERVPKYMLQVADSYVYINNQGYMLDVSIQKLDVPIILGFKTDLSNAIAGNRLDVEDLKKMETIIKIVETAKANEIDGYITKIDVSNNRNYTLVLDGEQKTVYLGDCSDLNTRMLYLNGILTQTRNLSGEIFLDMDLNTDDAYFREKT